MRIALFTFIGLLAVGCDTRLDIATQIDRKIFEYGGFTVLSQPASISLKEIHLDTGILQGTKVIVGGTVVERGPHETYIVVNDSTARMLVATADIPLTVTRSISPGQHLTVYGTIENGQKGLPFLRAEVIRQEVEQASVSNTNTKS